VGAKFPPLTAKSNLLRLHQVFIFLVQRSGTNATRKSEQKPIFISVFEHGSASPMFSAASAILAKCPLTKVTQVHAKNVRKKT